MDLSRPTQQPYYYEKKIRLVTTIRENGARKAGKKRERDEGVSQDSVQAEQTNGLRAPGPRGLEFRCGHATDRPPAARK